MTTRQERLRSDSTELELDGYEAPGSAGKYAYLMIGAERHDE